METQPRLGPYSRAIDRGSVGWSVDGRSREGRFLRAYEKMLAEHLGGKPSRVQIELIRRCARLALHLELQDEKSMTTGVMSDGTSKQYLAWSAQLGRTLKLLGMKGVAAREPSLAEIMATSPTNAYARPTIAAPAPVRQPAGATTPDATPEPPAASPNPAASHLDENAE